MKKKLKEYLILWADRYETPAFIENDPIQIPHRYQQQVDMEISALVVSWIATGSRQAIIKRADEIDREIFESHPQNETLEDYLYDAFDGLSPLQRLQMTLGHINGVPDVSSLSEAKKMCLFLRWMIRRDSCVDFGIWQKFHPRELIIPLDTHVHRISLGLGLTMERKCMKTACAITEAFTKIWPDDPVKGDFALFGFGANEPIV